MKDKKIRKAIKKSNLPKKVKKEVLSKFKKEKIYKSSYYDSYRGCGIGG